MKYRHPITIPDAKLNMSADQYHVYFCIMVYSHPLIYSKEMFVKLISLCLLFICTKFLLTVCLKIVMDCITVQKSSFFNLHTPFPFLPFVILLIRYITQKFLHSFCLYCWITLPWKQSCDAWANGNVIENNDIFSTHVFIIEAWICRVSQNKLQRRINWCLALSVHMVPF